MRFQRRGRTNLKREVCLTAYDTRHDRNTLSRYTTPQRKALADIPFILIPKLHARNGWKRSPKQFLSTRLNAMPIRYVDLNMPFRELLLTSFQWFAPNKIDDAVFRMRSSRVPPTSTELFTGAVSSAATFGKQRHSHLLR